MKRTCKHPKCGTPLKKFQKSRFCRNHRQWSTITRYRAFKYSANKRRLRVNITFRQYLTIIKKSCYYCRRSLMIMSGSGLDRKDNRYGYSMKNTLACCPTCNMARGSFFTVKEFKKVVAYLRKLRYNTTNLWPEYCATKKTKRR